MDKTFVNKLQSKLENFEAIVPKATWDKVNHDLNHPFETKLKGKLNGVGAFVGAGAWAAIQSNLPDSLENGLKSKLGAHETPVSATLWGAISSQVETMPGVFEEAMQDKLVNYESTPSAGVMDAVFARIGNKRAISWRRAASIAAAILLLFGIFYFTNKSGSVTPDFALNENNSSASKGGILAYEESNNKGFNSENENIASFINENEFQDNADGLNNTAMFGKEESNHISDNSLTHNKKGVNGGDNGNGNHFNEVGSGNNSKGPNSINNAFAINDKSSSINSKDFSSKIVSEFLASISTDLPFINSVDLEEGSFDKSIKPKNIAFAAQPQPAIETPNETKPIDFSVVTSNGAFAMQTKSHRMLAAYDESFTDFNENIYQTGSYNSLGVNLAMGVSDKTQLLGGLQLTHARNQLEFDIHNNGSPTSFNRLVDNGTVVTNYFSPVSNQLAEKRGSKLEYENVDIASLNGDSVISGNRYRMTNTYFFVDVPVGFEFDLVSRHKSSVSARIGAKIRMIAGANSYHINNDRDQIIEVSSAVSQAFYQTSMVGFSGVQYQKSLTNDYEFFVGPEVNLNLTDINRNGTWVSMRPLQFGLNLGIRQKLS